MNANIYIYTNFPADFKDSPYLYEARVSLSLDTSKYQHTYVYK